MESKEDWVEQRKKEIYYDKEQLEAYKKEFPTVAIVLQRQADNLLVYYNQKPFKSSLKQYTLQKIKRVLNFHNPNWEEQERIKKEEKEKKKLEKFKTEAGKVFSPKGQAETFTGLQPLFYDKVGNWWLWNFNDFKWEMVDEVDILNMVEMSTGADIISPKERTIILNSLKQEGRKKIPKNINKNWIQFKNIFYDIMTGEEIEVNPEYFATNPIPWGIKNNKDMNTPIMDKIFEEWVGEKYVKTLYEIIAYCLLPSYPIHRLFCFIGSGLNGKSCFIRLLNKFIGIDNVTSTELDTLLCSRFEITRLYKKLICVMGETNFSEINKTSVIKKLTGQDTIGFEYKNKTPFDGENYAKIIIATNNLPATTDKTIGFYRRWLIVDFPNRFSEEKDILEDIPEEEYECLAFKSAWILKDLLESRKFTNEGTIEEREKAYEDKSNPFDKFWKENIEEDPDGNISKKQFSEKLNSWCKEKRFRQLSDVTISSCMKNKGIETVRLTMEWVEVSYGQSKPRYFAWAGIKWKG